MTKFKDLSPDALIDIADKIDVIFVSYNLDQNSIMAFWECVDIGRIKQEVV